MPRAIILEPPGHLFDLTDVARFGLVKYLFDPRGPHPFRQEEFRSEVNRRLDEVAFDPDVDYVVLVGKTTKFLYLSLEVVARYGRVKLLQFDATRAEYFVQHIGQQYEHDRPAITPRLDIVPHDGIGASKGV